MKFKLEQNDIESIAQDVATLPCSARKRTGMSYSTSRASPRTSRPQRIGACDAHLRSIVVTAFSTGMRRSEILNLQWDQVDLRHGFILLSRTKNGQRREIPINGTLRAVLGSCSAAGGPTPCLFQ